MDEAASKEIARTAKVELFYSPDHALIFRTIQAMVAEGQPTDMPNLHQRLVAAGDIEKAGGSAYISKLIDTTNDSLHWKSDLGLLAELAMMRTLYHTSQSLANRSLQPTDSAADICQGTIKFLQNLQTAFLGGAGGAQLLVTAEAFERMHTPDIEWLVDGIIQRGANGFIGSAPKVGKSWLVEDLAIALASGGPWLGAQTSRCKVALISREDNPGLTRWRLRELAQGRGISLDSLSEWLWVNTREQSAVFALDEPATVTEMIRALKAVRPDLAIFDVLNVLHHAEENDNTEMRRILESLSVIQAEAGCAIAVCHHFNKMKEGTLIERLRGSSAISGWAEWIVGIDRYKDGDLRHAKFEIKAACAPDDLWFTITSEGGSAWVNETAPPLEAPSRAGRILQ